MLYGYGLLGKAAGLAELLKVLVTRPRWRGVKQVAPSPLVQSGRTSLPRPVRPGCDTFP
jgi:hypothetical protein